MSGSGAGAASLVTDWTISTIASLLKQQCYTDKKDYLNSHRISGFGFAHRVLAKPQAETTHRRLQAPSLPAYDDALRSHIMESPQHSSTHHPTSHNYRRLAIELSIDFALMYFVMYTMIATVQHLRLNLNNVYMTLMMVAPMAVVMLVSMRSMFPSKRANAVLVVGAISVFIASFMAMRTQAAIGDKEFLRSMIPHHSGAILMCKEAKISDPEVIALCREIIASQTREITLMEGLLKRG